MTLSQNQRSSGRTLALDVGTRRIGLAVTDPLDITAQGLETLERTNRNADLSHLEEIIRKYEVTEIVVGHPLRMSGATGTQSDKIEVFAEMLRKRFQLPVHLWDERLTSAEANRILNQEGMTRIDRKGVVDQIAAGLILQSFMAARAARKTCEEEV